MCSLGIWFGIGHDEFSYLLQLFPQQILNLLYSSSSIFIIKIFSLIDPISHPFRDDLFLLM